MSNKRIDLTQFEGITPTQWRVDYEAVGDTKTVLYVKSDMTAHDNFVIAVLEDAPNGEYTEADANAIAAVPDLIAELKRCYERIDELEKEPSVTIDEWDIPSQGPCVTVRYNGREYVGTLDEWDTSEEE